MALPLHRFLGDVSSTKFCDNLRENTFHNPRSHITISLLTYQGKVVLVCTLCCLDVSMHVGVMMHLKTELQEAFYFSGGKPQSPWRDPERHKDVSKGTKCKRLF